MKLNKLHKLIFFIFLSLTFSIISCADTEGEFEPDYACFVTDSKFEVYYSGSTTNLIRIRMGVKKANMKEEIYDDLYYEQDFKDSWKNRIIVKSKKSHFSLEDDVEVRLYFFETGCGSKSITVRKSSS